MEELVMSHKNMAMSKRVLYAQLTAMRYSRSSAYLFIYLIRFKDPVETGKQFSFHVLKT